MKIIVTEATSSVAYHLLPLLASGGVLHNQPVHLVLCDKEEKRDDLVTVVQELQDWAFPSIAGISITANLCDDCKTADVVLVLPKENECGDHDRTAIAISCTSLSHIDFYGLGCAFHPLQIENEEMCSRKARGSMSSAAIIADSIKDIHCRSLNQVDTVMSELEKSNLREEAEFGCIPVPDIDIWQSCDHHLQQSRDFINTKTLVMCVSVKRISETDDDSKRQLEDMVCTRDVKYYARL